MFRMVCPVDADIWLWSEGGMVLTGIILDACTCKYEPSLSTGTVFFLFTGFLIDVGALSDALVFLFPSVAGDFLF